MTRRIERIAGERAALRRAEIAARIGEALGPRIGVAVEGERIVLSGRGLAAPDLRWRIAEALR